MTKERYLRVHNEGYKDFVNGYKEQIGATTEYMYINHNGGAKPEKTSNLIFNKASITFVCLTSNASYALKVIYDLENNYFITLYSGSLTAGNAYALEFDLPAMPMFNLELTTIVGGTLKTNYSFFFSSKVTISDSAYTAAWNSDLNAASKNSIYDKIQSLTLSDLASKSHVVLTDIGTLTHASLESEITTLQSAITALQSLQNKIAVIYDKKTNAAGGSITAFTWTTRTLNELLYSNITGCTLNSNRFTLNAGTYLIEWSCPGFKCDEFYTRLYNYTATAVISWGATSKSSSADNSQTRSVGARVVSPTSATEYRIDQLAVTSRAGDGLGVHNGYSATDDDIYTIVNIKKIA